MVSGKNKMQPRHFKLVPQNMGKEKRNKLEFMINFKKSKKSPSLPTL